jgi:hypothetical protein
VNTTYQWQSNIGFGFQNLDDAGQYSGTKTSRLKVSGIVGTNNNQLFRCKLSKNACEEITEAAALWLSTNATVELSQNRCIAYPIPAKNTVTIIHNSRLQASGLLVYDAAGRVVHNAICPKNNTYIDIEKWPAGTYSIKVVFEEGTLVTRLIKLSQ